MNGAIDKVKQNVDGRIVASSAIGVLAAGTAITLLNMAKFKKLAKTLKGGK